MQILYPKRAIKYKTKVYKTGAMVLLHKPEKVNFVALVKDIKEVTQVIKNVKKAKIKRK
jgi:hypothetical protein